MPRSDSVVSGMVSPSELYVQTDAQGSIHHANHSTLQVMIGTLTGLQWMIYDSFKIFMGLPTTGGADQHSKPSQTLKA